MSHKTVTGVSAEDYLATYADQYCERVNGEIIRMSPASQRHDALTAYFRHLVDDYLELNPIGRALSADFIVYKTRATMPPFCPMTMAIIVHRYYLIGL